MSQPVRSADELPDVGTPVERPVGPHLPPDTWHWVQFETMDGDRTAPQPALWNGRHWHGVGWKGIPFDGAILCGPCAMPLKVVAWRVNGPCMGGRIGGDLWWRAPNDDDRRIWEQLGIADQVTVQPLYSLAEPVSAVVRPNVGGEATATARGNL